MRETAGISLSNVATAAGINKGRLSIIERGVSPTEDEARKILAALQVEVVAKGDTSGNDVQDGRVPPGAAA